jgi:hypothetical protein
MGRDGLRSKAEAASNIGTIDVPPGIRPGYKNARRRLLSSRRIARTMPYAATIRLSPLYTGSFRSFGQSRLLIVGGLERPGGVTSRSEMRRRRSRQLPPRRTTDCDIGEVICFLPLHPLQPGTLRSNGLNASAPELLAPGVGRKLVSGGSPVAGTRKVKYCAGVAPGSALATTGSVAAGVECSFRGDQ